MSSGAITVLAVYTALMGALVVWAVRRAKANPPPPLRPERLRELYAKPPRKPPAASWVVAAMGRLMMLVPGVLLVVLADKEAGRITGAFLLAWFVVSTAWPLWMWLRIRRPGQLEAMQERELARSEAFWSQPDAEERAREMRRR